MSHDWRSQVARFGLVFAVVWFAIGQLITFYPGAEAGWFGTCAASALLGFFSPRRQTRIIATALVVLSLVFVCEGYWRGVRYQESTQPARLGIV